MDASPVLLVLQLLAARKGRSSYLRVVSTPLGAATAAQGAWGLAFVTLGGTHRGLAVPVACCSGCSRRLLLRLLGH